MKHPLRALALLILLSGCGSTTGNAVPPTPVLTPSAAAFNATWLATPGPSLNPSLFPSAMPPNPTTGVTPTAIPYLAPSATIRASNQALESFLQARMHRDTQTLEKYLTQAAKERYRSNGYLQLVMVPDLHILRWEIQQTLAGTPERAFFDVRFHFGEGDSPAEVGYFNDSIDLVRQGDAFLVDSDTNRYGFVQHLGESPGVAIWQQAANTSGTISPLLRPSYMAPGLDWAIVNVSEGQGMRASYGWQIYQLGDGGQSVGSPLVAVMAGAVNATKFGESREMLFRGTTATLSSRQNPQTGDAEIGLAWTEKGAWGIPDDQWHSERVPYAIWAGGKGISEAEVMKVANSLQPVALP